MLRGLGSEPSTTLQGSLNKGHFYLEHPEHIENYLRTGLDKLDFRILIQRRLPSYNRLIQQYNNRYGFSSISNTTYCTIKRQLLAQAGRLGPRINLLKPSPSQVIKLTIFVPSKWFKRSFDQASGAPFCKGLIAPQTAE